MSVPGNVLSGQTGVSAASGGLGPLISAGAGVVGGVLSNNGTTNTQNAASGLLTNAAFTNGSVNNGGSTAGYTTGTGWNIGQNAATPAGSALLNAGTSQLTNPLIGQAQGAASSNIGQAGQDFTSVYNTQLANLQQQLALPQQLQTNANATNEFARGTSGTTGGALQTQAMATGFGQADLAAAQQAWTQALQTQQAATSNAGVLGTLASNQQLTGGSLTGTGANVLNTGNQIGVNNATLGLQTGQVAGQLNIGAGNGLTALGTSNNNSQSTLGNILQSLGGSGTSSILNGIAGNGQSGSGILNQYNGNAAAGTSINNYVNSPTDLSNLTTNFDPNSGFDLNSILGGD